MFLGHHAAGLAAKRLAPRVSLGTLFAASMAIDLIWPVMLLLGIESVRIDPGNTAFTPLDFHDYPITHSLLSVIGWGVLFGAIHWMFRRSTRDAFVVGAAVLSHWVLDFLTHRPDLPLWPGGPRVGLGLWNNVAATIVVESLLFVGGLMLYLRMTRARDRIGSIALWALVIFSAAIYVANVTSPPPPNAEAIAWVGMAAWLFVPWGVWIDRHREARGGARGEAGGEGRE
ncbi:MAG TPA: metal-dependent hydrolase [Thermoanaerobaculia bacterium]|nr:metal-dependent hydrolase [Thermoanaerobaculia bacterium]